MNRFELGVFILLCLVAFAMCLVHDGWPAAILFLIGGGMCLGIWGEMRAKDPV